MHHTYTYTIKAPAVSRARRYAPPQILRGDRKNIIRRATRYVRTGRYRITDLPRVITAPRGYKGGVLNLIKHTIACARGAGADPLRRPVSERLHDYLTKLTIADVNRRRLSTPPGWGDLGIRLTDYDSVRRIWVVHTEGWYDYSIRAGTWRVSASYVTGRDDGQLWTARVPSTIKTVDAAVAWLTPQPIREAQQRGLPIRRQGDIFARPVRGLRDHDLTALDGTRHVARPRRGGGLTIVHPQHPPLILSGRYRWRLYQSRQIDGIYRTGAD